MYIFWVLSGITFFILDKYKNNTHYLSISLACLFTFIITYKFPDKSNYCFVYALFLYLLFLALLKQAFLKEKTDYIKETNLKEYTGQIATVTKEIGKSMSIDGIGQIEYNSELWQAKNITDESIKKGAKVKIVSKENSIMNVKAI